MRFGKKLTANISIGIALLILSLFSPCFLSCSQAQTNIVLNSYEQFSIPAYNGAVSFAANGTYSSATLQNDSWIFLNLRLNASLPLQNFTVSAQNSNITIFSYSALNFTSQTLFYTAEGSDKQIFNFGIRTQGAQFTGVDWSVITRGNVFLAEGDHWTISRDGTITVNGLAGNIMVVHWRNSSVASSTSNLPFYDQHSVGIATAITLAIIVSVAVAVNVKVKNREPAKKNLQSENGKAATLRNVEAPR